MTNLNRIPRTIAPNPKSQEAPKHKSHAPKPWLARIIALYKKAIRKMPDTTRKFWHETGVENAKKTLVNQYQRDGRQVNDNDLKCYIKPDSAVRVTKSDETMSDMGSIGDGGFGKVNLVFPNEAGPISVRKNNHSTTEALTLLRKEKELLTQMDHPNIVKASTRGNVTNSQLSMYMEHAGSTLTLFMKKLQKQVPQYKTGKSSETRKQVFAQDAENKAKLRMSVFSQILEGLTYLKSKKICHMDLKPDNILINPGDARVRIADFGFAFKTDSKETVPARGSIGYMASEIAYKAISYKKKLKYDEGSDIDKAISLSRNIKGNGFGIEGDMFSAGCIFYEILTGKSYIPSNPNFVNSYTKLMSRKLETWLTERTNPNSIPSMNQKEADKMVLLLTGMLQPDPSKRFTPEQAQKALSPEPSD